jgi:hypothetical protein
MEFVVGGHKRVSDEAQQCLYVIIQLSYSTGAHFFDYTKPGYAHQGLASSSLPLTTLSILSRTSGRAPGTRGEKTCARAGAPLRSRLRRTKHTYLPFLRSGDREALDDLCALVSTAAFGLGLGRNLGGGLDPSPAAARRGRPRHALEPGELQAARHACGRAERQRARG